MVYQEVPPTKTSLNSRALRLLDWTADGRYLAIANERTGKGGLHLLPIRDGNSAGAPVLLSTAISKRASRRPLVGWFTVRSNRAVFGLSISRRLTRIVARAIGNALISPWATPSLLGPNGLATAEGSCYDAKSRKGSRQYSKSTRHRLLFGCRRTSDGSFARLSEISRYVPLQAAIGSNWSPSARTSRPARPVRLHPQRQMASLP